MGSADSNSARSPPPNSVSAPASAAGLLPDLTIVLDVSDGVAVQRRVRRGAADDRYERLDAGFHARVKAGFREITHAAPERCTIVDADVDVQAVHLEIMRRVDRFEASDPANRTTPAW